MNDSQTLRPGTTLYNGDYRIISILGRGGFGITYLAENVNLGKRVAIKEFFPSGMYERDDASGYASLGSSDNRELSGKLKTKFLKEARRIASLDHESIVRVTAAFEENGTAYYVMDLIEGRDLNTIVKQQRPLPIARAVGYVTQVGKALEYLHSLHLNHLDVKPANILINPKTDKAVLIDFGLSKQYDNGGHQTSTTPVGISEGYAPIEQYKSGGVQEFSAPTDVYSLAATLYYLLTGQRPKSSNDLVEEELTFPANIPGYLQTAISRAMSTRRSDRYQTVADFLAAINATSVTSFDADATVIQYPTSKKAPDPEVVVSGNKMPASKNEKGNFFKSGKGLLSIVVLVALGVVVLIVNPFDKCSRNDADSALVEDELLNDYDFWIKKITRLKSDFEGRMMKIQKEIQTKMDAGGLTMVDAQAEFNQYFEKYGGEFVEQVSDIEKKVETHCPEVVSSREYQEVLALAEQLRVQFQAQEMKTENNQ